MGLRERPLVPHACPCLQSLPKRCLVGSNGGMPGRSGTDAGTGQGTGAAASGAGAVSSTGGAACPCGGGGALTQERPEFFLDDVAYLDRINERTLAQVVS